MTNPTTDPLAESMKSGSTGAQRPSGRRRPRAGDGRRGSVSQDAAEIAVDHVETDPINRGKCSTTTRSRISPRPSARMAAAPIIVYRPEESDTFESLPANAVTGRRSAPAGLPCHVRDAADFDRGLVDQLQLVENIQRADLRPLEAAEAIEEYMARHGLSHAKRHGG